MDKEQMTALTKDVASISEKVRILHAAGVPKGDISRFVERRYQQVYNIILAVERKAGGTGPPVPVDDGPSVFTAVIGKGGKVVLPPEWLEVEGLAEGDALVFRREADGLKIMTQAAARDILLEAARRRMPGEAALLESILRSTGQTRKT
jgi:bifunctional DNA-binding transcriptional regulator/antitoxin component of YhaV-PrlF toxin-antitoxin module